MQIVVLTNGELKAELLANVDAPAGEIVWIDEPAQFQKYAEADVFIDLLFEKDHVKLLQNFLPKLIIINSVIDTLSETDPSFVRINGWPSLLKSQLVEAAALKEEQQHAAGEVFSIFNKKMEWLPDETGLVTPRVISTIINEAFIALQEGVSTKEEMDTAMKLGTNYPYGPFEWAEKIGRDRISALLDKLSQHKKRYTGFVV